MLQEYHIISLGVYPYGDDSGDFYVPSQAVLCEILPQVSVLLQGVKGAALHLYHLSAKSLAAPSLARTDSHVLKSCSLSMADLAFGNKMGAVWYRLSLLSSRSGRIMPNLMSDEQNAV